MILQNDASLIGGVGSGLACDATFVQRVISVLVTNLRDSL